MSKSRTYVENKLKSSNSVLDVAKWHFHNKSSKRIWATLQWLNRNEMLTDDGIENFNNGYKGLNNVLRISEKDVTSEGLKVMTQCYPSIGDQFNKVDTILSRCYKKL